MIHRSSGVLLHISSLPGDYGIGSFGQEAVEFARQLHGCGFSFWQTLPFTTTDQYNSPYTSYSAFAGNPFFIDLPSLGRQGLLTDEELAANRYPTPYAVDYGWLRKTRDKTLRRAFTRMGPGLKEQVEAFAAENDFWLPDYALFIALKGKYDEKAWMDWPDKEIRMHEPAAVEAARAELAMRGLFRYPLKICQKISRWGTEF